MDRLTAFLAVLTALLTLLGAMWRGARGLHRFVSAVTTNTAAVSGLADRLGQHTDASNRRMDQLDQRVTLLERDPR